MKKLIVIAGFSLALAGCFDDKSHDKVTAPKANKDAACEAYADQVACATDAACRWEAKEGKTAACKAL